MESISLNIYNYLQNFVKRITIVQITTEVICGILGFLFYYFTSYSTDELIINLNPFITVLYSMFLGAMISIKHS